MNEKAAIIIMFIFFRKNAQKTQINLFKDAPTISYI